MTGRLTPTQLNRLTLVAAGGAAVVIGSGTAINVGFAAAGTVAIGVLVTFARNAVVLLYLLVVALFAEIVSLNGIPISRVVAPIALLLLVLLAARGRLRIPRSTTLLWITAYSVWALASGLWTVDLSGTAFLLGSLLIALTYLVAFAGLVTSNSHLERVLMAIAIAAFATGVFAIAAFLLGASEELQLGRAEGGAGDPNFFALYEIMALPLVFVLAGQARTRFRRLFLFGTVLVIVGAVITTVSRGGLLTLAVLLLLLLVLPARRTIFRSRGEKAALATLVAVGVLLALQFGSDTILPRVESVFAARDSAALGAEGRGNGRLNIWLGAFTAIKERPLQGLGYGGFQPTSTELIQRTPGVDLTSYELHPRGQPAHSVYIGTMAELGLTGLVLLLGMIASAYASLRRTAARARELGNTFVMRVSKALVLSLLGWAVASFFLSSETSRILWIVLGLTLAIPTLLPDARSGRTATPATAAPAPEE